eukprot:s1039_g14.t1
MYATISFSRAVKALKKGLPPHFSMDILRSEGLTSKHVRARLQEGVSTQSHCTKHVLATMHAKMRGARAKTGKKKPIAAEEAEEVQARFAKAEKLIYTGKLGVACMLGQWSVNLEKANGNTWA